MFIKLLQLIMSSTVLDTKIRTFRVTPRKRHMEQGLVIVQATQIQVVMPLHSYQTPQATFPLLSDAYKPEPYPASIINVENYQFQIGC